MIIANKIAVSQNINLLFINLFMFLFWKIDNVVLHHTLTIFMWLGWCLIVT